MKPQIMNNWDPPDTVHARVVADQFGGTYEILGKLLAVNRSSI